MERPRPPESRQVGSVLVSVASALAEVRAVNLRLQQQLGLYLSTKATTGSLVTELQGLDAQAQVLEDLAYACLAYARNLPADQTATDLDIANFVTLDVTRRALGLQPKFALDEAASDDAILF